MDITDQKGVGHTTGGECVELSALLGVHWTLADASLGQHFKGEHTYMGKLIYVTARGNIMMQIITSL
jgi:hypothetical protein